MTQNDERAKALHREARAEHDRALSEMRKADAQRAMTSGFASMLTPLVEGIGVGLIGALALLAIFG